MSKILLTGSTQIKHIAGLLADNGYTPRVLEASIKNRKMLIKYYLKYFLNLLTVQYVYIVYAPPNNSIQLIIPQLLRKKIVLHWIGTDVYNYIHNDSSARPYAGNIYHLTGSNLLYSELKEKGIKSDVIPIVPFDMKLELTKMPEKHEVLVYLPSGREEFYRADIVSELAKRNAYIKFHIVANTYYEPLNLPNVIFHGQLSPDKMNELYSNISILVRLPEHDGLSMMVIEALAKGKQVLYKYEHPFVYTPEVFDIDCIDSKFKEIIEKVPEINLDGHNYVLSNYNEDTMMKLYREHHVFE